MSKNILSTNILVYYWTDTAYGELDGLFITTREELHEGYGKLARFGEVLGQHSEVESVIDEKDFTVKSEDPLLIVSLLQTFCQRDLCGFNPLKHI